LPCVSIIVAEKRVGKRVVGVEIKTFGPTTDSRPYPGFDHQTVICAVNVS
jgi:hypothetical protein